MLRFLGLVPPPALALQVTTWRQALGHQMTSEPHVTVKAQPGLTPDLEWLPRVEAACRAFPHFPVTLSGVRTFADQVIYLAVEAPAIEDLHLALLAAAPSPEPSPFEGRGAYVPHLTLAMADGPLPFHEALIQARQTFIHPVTFEVSFVRLYGQSAPGEPYAAERDLPLGR